MFANMSSLDVLAAASIEPIARYSCNQKVTYVSRTYREAVRITHAQGKSLK